MRLDALIGKQLGRYQIEALIGRGGMAAVYRAFDPALQRQVALKVLYPQYLADADLVERFRREAVTAAGLDHPHIAPIYDVGEADGLVYLAMKLLPGPSLAELLRREGRLPPARVVVIVVEVAAALDEAHRAGIVHRDIKPGNVLFDRYGHAILTDFGIAKSLEGASLTESSVLIGTPDYIAPEQIDSALAPDGKVDARADIYGLGAMVYRALTGRRPFDGTAQAVLLAHLREEPVPPSTLVPELPAEIDAVIARAMAKHPEARYTTAGAFARDLLGGDQATAVGVVFPAAALRRDAHTHPTTEAAPPKATSPTPHPTPLVTEDAGRRRRVRPFAALVTLLFLLGLGAGLYRFANAESTRRPANGGAAETAVATSSAVSIAGAPATATATDRPTATVSPTIAASATTAPTEIATAAATSAPAPSATSAPSTPSASATAPQGEAWSGGVPFPPAPNPTPRPTATSAPPTRPSAPPTQPPPPTRTPAPPTQPLPPPTKPAPKPTATTKPTLAPSPTAQPTATAAACSVPLQGGFGRLWQTNLLVQAGLGCPVRGEIAGQAAEQVFEQGRMYWWANNQQIYVLLGGQKGTWHAYPNTYKEGEELPPLTPPAGLFAPVRGFGKLWINNSAVQDVIGWGLGPERGLTGVYQRFERGVMLYSTAGSGHDPQIYVLYGNSTYAIYPDTP